MSKTIFITVLVLALIALVCVLLPIFGFPARATQSSWFLQQLPTRLREAVQPPRDSSSAPVADQPAYVDQNGRTALHHYLINRTNKEAQKLVRDLLTEVPIAYVPQSKKDREIFINAQDKESKWTAMHLAVQKDNLPVLKAIHKFILDYDLKVDTHKLQDSKDRSPFMLAAQLGRTNFLKEFVSMMEDRNTIWAEADAPATPVPVDDDEFQRTLKLLQKRAKGDIKEEDGKYAELNELQWAARLGHKETVKWLLDFKVWEWIWDREEQIWVSEAADRDLYGRTALMHACMAQPTDGNTDDDKPFGAAAIVLKESSTDVQRFRDKFDRTFWYYCLQHGQYRVLLDLKKLIMEKGAHRIFAIDAMTGADVKKALFGRHGLRKNLLSRVNAKHRQLFRKMLDHLNLKKSWEEMERRKPSSQAKQYQLQNNTDKHVKIEDADRINTSPLSGSAASIPTLAVA